MKLTNLVLSFFVCAARWPGQVHGAGDSPSAEDLLEARNYQRGGAVNLIRYGDIEGWDKLGDRHAIVHAGDSGDFILRFRRSCKHLEKTSD